MPAPAEISRRLKAARWLAGGVDQDGKPKQLKVAELAKRSPLPENKITANRLEEIEQLVITAPPMELDKIAEALGLPHSWFSAERVAPIAPDIEAVEEAIGQLSERLAGLGATLDLPRRGNSDRSDKGGTSAEGPQVHGQGTP